MGSGPVPAANTQQLQGAMGRRPKATSIPTTDAGWEPGAEKEEIVMPTINLDDSPFEGRTSTPPTNRAESSDCRHCGSQLARRYIGVRFIGGAAKRVWACPCGHERWCDVEAAAA
jgi:hypothetical protein